MAHMAVEERSSVVAHLDSELETSNRLIKELAGISVQYLMAAWL